MSMLGRGATALIAAELIRLPEPDEPPNPAVPSAGNVSSSQNDALVIQPVRNAMPVRTRSTPMTFSTTAKRERIRFRSATNGFMANAASRNGMPRPTE